MPRSNPNKYSIIGWGRMQALHSQAKKKIKHKLIKVILIKPKSSHQGSPWRQLFYFYNQSSSILIWPIRSKKSRNRKVSTGTQADTIVPGVAPRYDSGGCTQSWFRGLHPDMILGVAPSHGSGGCAQTWFRGLHQVTG